MTCSCGSDKIENPDTGLCASCGAAERKAERNARKVTIVKPVAKMAPKRAGQHQEYMKLRRDYLALYPICECEGCERKSIDIHHQGGREGDRLLDTNFFMAVCREHHAYYTTNSAEAISKGYSIQRTI